MGLCMGVRTPAASTRSLSLTGGPSAVLSPGPKLHYISHYEPALHGGRGLSERTSQPDMLPRRGGGREWAVASRCSAALHTKVK